MTTATVLTVLFVIFVAIDSVVYVWTSSERRSTWPWWKYLPGGAIVARMQIKGGIKMRCPECGRYPMDQKTVLKGKDAKTTYECPKCGHSFAVTR